MPFAVGISVNMLLGHLRTTFKDTVIPLEGTEGAKMSSSAMELKGFGGMHGAWGT